MPTADQVNAAREENNRLREQIAQKQADNEKLVDDANNAYRLQRFERENEQLQAQLNTLNERPAVAVPQVFDDTQVYADTVQPAAAPEVSKGKPTPAPASSPSSTPTDVATIKPQGE